MKEGNHRTLSLHGTIKKGSVTYLVPEESIQIHLFGINVPNDLLDEKYYNADIKISNDLFQVNLSTDLYIRPPKASWSGHDTERIIVFAFDSDKRPKIIVGCKINIVVKLDSETNISSVFQEYRRKIHLFYERK